MFGEAGCRDATGIFVADFPAGFVLILPQRYAVFAKNIQIREEKSIFVAFFLPSPIFHPTFERLMLHFMNLLSN